MSLFQMLVLLAFGAMLALALAAGLRGTIPKRVVALACAIAGLGSVAVTSPHAISWLAHALGIGRGADLLSYLTALAMTMAFFYMYVRFRRVERQLTLLVRRLAIHNAEDSAPARARASLPGTPSQSVIAPRWEASDAKRGA